MYNACTAATTRITRIAHNFAPHNRTRRNFSASIVQSVFFGQTVPKLTHHRSLATYHRMGKKKGAAPITEDKYHVPAHSSLNDGKSERSPAS